MSSASTRSEDRFEALIEQYEVRWRRGCRPQIEQAIAQIRVAGDEDRLALLYELVAVDLEYRWRVSPRPGPLLEQYVKRLPELSSPDALPVELIAEEYRVRWRFGDRPMQITSRVFPATANRCVLS